jgi:hypothetical protein
MRALVAKQFVFYVVASTRGAEVLASLLGTVYRGILCNGRWVAYLSYRSGSMQLCWVHRKRNSRSAVQWRKIRFGNRSRQGELATAGLLTVAQSCQRQQRHVLGYLTHALRCHRRHIAPPSLLPHRNWPPECYRGLWRRR